MAEQTEVIRNQMEETRSNLAEKLEALESQVTETVQSATEAVAETVQSATEAVAETVEAVKETVENVTESVGETVQSVGNFFDLRHQADQHPWVIFGGSVALGCMVSQLFGGKDSERASSGAGSWSSPPLEPSWRQPAPSPQPAAAEPVAQASSTGQKSWLSEEFDRLKSLGLGALMGVVRDMVKRSLPGELGKRAADEVDTLATKMGAQTFREPLLPE